MDGPTALDKGADILKAAKKNPAVAKAGMYLDDAASSCCGSCGISRQNSPW